MKQKMSKKNIMTLLMAMVFSFTTIVGAIVVSFSIWSGNKQSVPVVSEDFNASEDDFTFYAAIENIANDGGYDYYPLDSVPEDLSSLIKGLAVVRYEAFNKTAYIPSYPEVTILGKKYNVDGAHNYPVIHILKGYYSTSDYLGNNGLARNDSIETLIIPSTVNYI